MSFEYSGFFPISFSSSLTITVIVDKGVPNEWAAAAACKPIDSSSCSFANINSSLFIKINNQNRHNSSDEEMVLNIGPQHPSTHGVLRLKTITDGEIIKKITPYIGYLHRCFEKHC